MFYDLIKFGMDDHKLSLMRKKINFRKIPHLTAQHGLIYIHAVYCGFTPDITHVQLLRNHQNMAVLSQNVGVY